VKELSKSQAIRVLDVIVIAPALVYAGTLLVPKKPALGAFLVITGFATAAYNYSNWKHNEAASRARG
jgi:uncharacterized membrane protein YidH (DUF202 family)